MSVTSRRVVGKDFLVKIGSSPAAILGQTNGTITLSADTIDMTTKSDYPFKSNYCGLQGWEVSLSGAYYVGDGGSAVSGSPFALAVAGTAASITVDINGDTYAGSGIITSCSASGDLADKTTYDITITGDGELTLTPASS